MKNLLLLFIAILLIPFSMLAQSGWVQQTSGTTVDLLSVQFINSDVGWAVGDTVILKTTDGGNTWETVQLNNMVSNTVHFLDENIGWVGGSSICGPYQRSHMTIIKTTDGGSSWEICLIDSSDMGSEFLSCQFIDPYMGWVVGYFTIELGSIPQIRETTDGGETWIVHPWPGPPIHYGTFTSIYFVDSNKGYATLVGGSGYDNPSYYSGSGAVYFTTTGGDEWGCQWGCQEGEAELYDVYFINENIGWVVGEEGTILKTTDGGNNWLPETSNDSVKLQSTYFVDSLTGWICGEQGIIAYTTNGGIDWLKQQSGTTSYLNAICFIDENNGWVVGNNGVILQTATGGVVSVEGETNDIPIKYNLTQNYPNPFNPSTKIKYSIPHSSDVKIKVFDVLGNEIAKLVNEAQPAGTYEITWNAGGQPSGFYFYQLKAGDFIQTKKMILLK